MLPENYVVECATKEETNIVMNSLEKNKDCSNNYWNYWSYCCFKNKIENISNDLNYVKEWFENKEYIILTFKEWEEMKDKKECPKYWFIRITEETLDAVNKVRAKQPKHNDPLRLNQYPFYTTNLDNIICGVDGNFIHKEAVELSLEEFKFYFLEKEKVEKPYKDNREVTYEMITTHPYFRTLEDEELRLVLEYMDFAGYHKLQGKSGKNKLENLKNLFKKENMQKLTISIQEALEIHKIACSTWKSKFAQYLTRVDSEQNITFTQLEVDEMFEAATSSQKPVLEKIFGLQNIIEWDKIKTGSKLMIKSTKHIITNNEENLNFKEPFEVIFWKTKYSIDSTNVFQPTCIYNSYCTLSQKGKFVRFNTTDNTNFVTEVIEY